MRSPWRAGPRSGDLRFGGLILAQKPLAVDAVIARLVGLEPSEVPVLALAKE